MSAMSPYLSDCMPDERVATQPPRRRVGEAVGEVPDGPALRVQLLPRGRARARRPGCGRDRTPRRSRSSSFIRPMSSEMHDAVLVGARLEAAGDVAAAAERDDHGVRRDRRRRRPAAPRPRRPGRPRRRGCARSGWRGCGPGRGGSCRRCARRAPSCRWSTLSSPTIAGQRRDEAPESPATSRDRDASSNVGLLDQLARCAGRARPRSDEGREARACPPSGSRRPRRPSPTTSCA